MGHLYHGKALVITRGLVLKMGALTRRKVGSPAPRTVASQ